MAYFRLFDLLVVIHSTKVFNIINYFVMTSLTLFAISVVLLYYLLFYLRY